MDLNRQSDLDEKIKATLPDLWLPLIGDETPIILDLSDLAKPLGKKMDYLGTVRDGSTGQTGRLCLQLPSHLASQRRGCGSASGSAHRGPQGT